jgi:atypical dual specificity phosphatase
MAVTEQPPTSPAGVYGIVPNAFDWLIPNRLGACVDPNVGEQAARWLHEGGISVVINLHERPDPQSLLDRLGASGLHLPVPGSAAPTQEQLDSGVRVIGDALQRGDRVAVHCGAGLGRAGTLLAAYLVSQGASPEAAIERVRAARRGSVETLEQEQAVFAFATRRQTSEGCSPED